MIHSNRMIKQGFIHYGHAFIGLYVMFGGFMAFPIAYTLLFTLNTNVCLYPQLTLAISSLISVTYDG